jgi:hypothetical protein
MAGYIYGHKSDKKNYSYMQSSMGYTCSKCEDTFLVGYINTETEKRFCIPCGNEEQDKSKLEEKIY